MGMKIKYKMRIGICVLFLYPCVYLLTIREFALSGGGTMPWAFPWSSPSSDSYPSDPLPVLAGAIQERELRDRMHDFPGVVFEPLIRIDNALFRKGLWDRYLKDEKLDEDMLE